MPGPDHIKDKREILEYIYAAFNRRDINVILPKMKSDVEWPNGMEGGWVHGHEGVRAYWMRQWGMIDPHVEPTRFESADDGSVVVHVHQVVRDLSGNVLMDRMVQHVYRFDDGLIERMDIRE